MQALEERVRQALNGLKVPRLNKSLIEAGSVQSIDVEGSRVSVKLHFNIPAYTSKSQLRDWVMQSLRALDGVSAVQIDFSATETATPRTAKETVKSRHKVELPQVQQIVAVFSGKGGVGKSTVSVNLAVALAQDGLRVGLFDADVHGPNIPTLLGLTGSPKASGGKLVPCEKYGIQVMSIGLLVGSDEPLIWRGPMISKAINELLESTAWSDLDLLVVDLPPGTGDAQLGLAQDVRISGSIAVSTPQSVALEDVRRGVAAFRKLDVPIFGMVENMAYFVCPGCGRKTEIFGAGGAEAEGKRLGIPLLGRLPLEPQIRADADRGLPIVASAPSSDSAGEFRQIARQLWQACRGQKGGPS